MKTIFVYLAVVSSTSCAFTVHFRPATSTRRAIAQYSEQPDGKGELDLDLEEMFTMFDAVDKGEDFDDAIKKVKKDE